MPKRGRMSKEEWAYIHENASRMSVEAIAKKLDRTTEPISEYIKQNVPLPGVGNSERVSIRQELRNSESWKNLRNEFIEEELKYFEEAYVKLMTQFKGDVLPSEEMQIFQAIKYEILMSRNLKERRRAREEIERLEKMQEDFLKPFKGDPLRMSEAQRGFSLSLETQLNVNRQAEQSRTNEYVKLQEREDALMKGLKAVRDQRVKQVENSKVSFLGVIKMLMEKDVQEREGRQMELLKLAGQKEYVRLGRPHKYADGNEDSPILSADTVDLGPEEDET